MTANQPWHTRCGLQPCYGLVWSVPALAPGASVTLTSAPGNFATDYSAWPGSFAAGTTDVGWTLTVTDRQTGAFETYVNQLGQPSKTVTDIAAFDCAATP